MDKRLILPILAALAVGVYAGSAWFAPDPGPRAPTILERAPTEILDSLERMTDEVGSLRSRLQGRDTVRTVEIRWDTVRVPVPDTVTLSFVLDYRAGEAGAVVGAMDSTRTTLTPGLRRFALPENCDDGLYYGPRGLVCDRAEFGHLSPYLGAGAAWTVDGFVPVAEAGLLWRPSWRSRWSAAAFVEAAASGLSGRLILRRVIR